MVFSANFFVVVVVCVCVKGGFDTELKAARAYDVAALLCKGPGTPTNFPEKSYASEVDELKGLNQVRSARVEIRMPIAWQRET